MVELIQYNTLMNTSILHMKILQNIKVLFNSFRWLQMIVIDPTWAES